MSTPRDHTLNRSLVIRDFLPLFILACSNRWLRTQLANSGSWVYPWWQGDQGSRKICPIMGWLKVDVWNERVREWLERCASLQCRYNIPWALCNVPSHHNTLSVVQTFYPTVLFVDPIQNQPHLTEQCDPVWSCHPLKVATARVRSAILTQQPKRKRMPVQPPKKTYPSLERPNIRLVGSGPIYPDANFGCNIEEHWYVHVSPETMEKKTSEYIQSRLWQRGTAQSVVAVPWSFPILSTWDSTFHHVWTRLEGLALSMRNYPWPPLVLRGLLVPALANWHFPP